jgi:hypothetical protein
VNRALPLALDGLKPGKVRRWWTVSALRASIPNADYNASHKIDPRRHDAD